VLGVALGACVGMKVGADVSVQMDTMLNSNIPTREVKATVNWPEGYQAEGTTILALFVLSPTPTTVARISLPAIVPSLWVSVTLRKNEPRSTYRFWIRINMLLMSSSSMNVKYTKEA
jgi:hypothetical protein